MKPPLRFGVASIVTRDVIDTGMLGYGVYTLNKLAVYDADTWKDHPPSPMSIIFSGTMITSWDLR
jgi:hypothetical protein